MTEIYCKKCGNIVRPTDLYCRICGSPLDPKTVAEKTIQPVKPEQGREGVDSRDIMSYSFRRKSALVWLGFLLILAGFLIFVLAFSHFPSKYWDRGGEVRWYEIAGMMTTNVGEGKFTYGLYQPEKDEPTSEELKQLAIARNPSFFTQSPVKRMATIISDGTYRMNELTFLMDHPGYLDFKSDFYNKGYKSLVGKLAAFEIIPIRPRNGFIVAVASVVFGLILIVLGRRKTMS